MCPAPLQDFKYLQSDDRYTQKHLADDGERDRGKIREGRVGEVRLFCFFFKNRHRYFTEKVKHLEILIQDIDVLFTSSTIFY